MVLGSALAGRRGGHRSGVFAGYMDAAVAALPGKNAPENTGRLEWFSNTLGSVQSCAEWIFQEKIHSVSCFRFSAMGEPLARLPGDELMRNPLLENGNLCFFRHPD
jgi:hypothetical protein